MSAAALLQSTKCINYKGSSLKHESFPATQSLTYGLLYDLADVTEKIEPQKMYYVDVCLYGIPGNSVICFLSDTGQPANSFPYYADIGLKWTQTIDGTSVLLQTDVCQSGVPIVSDYAANVFPGNGRDVNGTFVPGDVGNTDLGNNYQLLKFGGPLYTGDDIGQTLNNAKITFHLPPVTGNHTWELSADPRYSYVRLYEIETLDSSF